MENEGVYLIHGFASAPKNPSEKAAVLERAFNLPVKQLHYDSDGNFQGNMAALTDQIELPPRFFVGTSLGAFYASKLAEQFYAENSAMPIMLNPCHNPVKLLNSIKGAHVNFVTEKYFELTSQTVDSYQGVPFVDAGLTMPRWILLNMDDELIDASETHSLYENVLEVISFEHGGHRFENIGSKEVFSTLERIGNSWFVIGITND